MRAPRNGYPEDWRDIFGDEAVDGHETTDLSPRDYLISPEKRAFDRQKIGNIAPYAVVPIALGLLSIIAFDRVNPLFGQTRVGYLGEPLDIYKLRTMPGETNHTASKGHDDDRRSRVGRVLSKLRIDEAPQLLNIWRGEMSVIGPRLILPTDYSDAVHILGPKRAYEWFRVRSQALPGAFDEFAVRLYGHDLEGDAETLLLERVAIDERYVLEAASLEEDARVFDMGKDVARAYARAKLGRSSD